jgi:hypothetical protein
LDIIAKENQARKEAEEIELEEIKEEDSEVE